MTKPKKTNEHSSPPELLEPVSVTQTESEKAKKLTINVPPGHVYIVGLNPDGTEKEGSGFFYPERSYLRIYGDKTKYSVKKKAH
ncbi:MAG: hypothetical protein H3C54_05110 [Taibaiella sp.]|nr:hypothetical protein [Taibaiella sp.]